MFHRDGVDFAVLPRFGQQVYIDEQACVIGDVALGDDASVWPSAVYHMNSPWGGLSGD